MCVGRLVRAPKFEPSYEEQFPCRKKIAEQLEQEARTALLEDHASLMQGYKIYILRLLWVLGMGSIVAGVFYCIAGFAYQGKLTEYSLSAAPSPDPQYAQKALLLRVSLGIRAEALNYLPQSSRLRMTCRSHSAGSRMWP